MENSTINAVLSELNSTAFGAVNKRSSTFNKNTIPNIALEMDTQMSSFNLTVCQRGKHNRPSSPTKEHHRAKHTLITPPVSSRKLKIAEKSSV